MPFHSCTRTSLAVPTWVSCCARPSPPADGGGGRAVLVGDVERRLRLEGRGEQRQARLRAVAGRVLPREHPEGLQASDAPKINLRELIVLISR